MKSPEEFLKEIGGTNLKIGEEPVLIMPAAHEAMRLYAIYVAAEQDKITKRAMINLCTGSGSLNTILTDVIVNLQTKITEL